MLMLRRKIPSRLISGDFREGVKVDAGTGMGIPRNDAVCFYIWRNVPLVLAWCMSAFFLWVKPIFVTFPFEGMTTTNVFLQNSKPKDA